MRTWMIKRKKRAAVPVQDLSGVRLEPEFMIGNRRERFKSNASERCDNVGLDQLEDLCRIAERHNLTTIARVP